MDTNPGSIKALLDRYGSDKGRWYGGLYGVLLRPVRNTIGCVIEIGIGTMIPGAPSSMVGWAADHYRPGGSLRAWRDFLPNARIHGVDPAPDTQIEGEPRIVTHLCDSANPEQAERVLQAVSPAVPDLIIDDGYHYGPIQIATFNNFFPALRPGGLYIVEDVEPDEVPIICDAIGRIDPGCDFFVDRSWGTCVAIVIRKAFSAPDSAHPKNGS